MGKVKKRARGRKGGGGGGGAVAGDPIGGAAAGAGGSADASGDMHSLPSIGGVDMPQIMNAVSAWLLSLSPLTCARTLPFPTLPYPARPFPFPSLFFLPLLPPSSSMHTALSFSYLILSRLITLPPPLSLPARTPMAAQRHGRLQAGGCLRGNRCGAG